ncbi:MAG: DUF177 domain-containing protein [Chloroflexota bacterium]|nr:DUF177 domain-containing protein [Chloroflexota bacterium]
MILNVAGLLREQPGVTRGYRLRDYYVNLAPEVELAGPISGHLRLQRTNRSVLVRGEVHAAVRRTCGRCTDAYVENARVRLDEEFLPTLDITTGAPVAVRGDREEALRINAHHEIDLLPVVRDELALTEPMLALCRPDCPGLCPGCGRRLDEGSCSCVVDEGDERLAVLARLLERSEPGA